MLLVVGVAGELLMLEDCAGDDEEKGLCRPGPLEGLYIHFAFPMLAPPLLSKHLSRPSKCPIQECRIDHDKLCSGSSSSAKDRISWELGWSFLLHVRDNSRISRGPVLRLASLEREWTTNR